MLGFPGGQWLIGAVGLAVVVVGGHHVLSGVTGELLETVRRLPSPPAGRARRILGQQPFGAAILVAVGLGFIALGAFAVVRARCTDA